MKSKKPQFVVIVRGLQGSGKSTVSNALQMLLSDHERNVVRLDMDVFDLNKTGVYDPSKDPEVFLPIYRSEFRHELSEGNSIIFSSVLTTEDEVKDFVQSAEMFEVPCFVLMIKDGSLNTSIQDDVIEATKHLWEEYPNEVTIGFDTPVSELMALFEGKINFNLTTDLTDEVIH